MTLNNLTNDDIVQVPEEQIQRETFKKGIFQVIGDIVVSAKIGAGRYGLIDVYLNSIHKVVRREEEIKQEPIGTVSEVKGKSLLIMAFIPVGRLRGDDVIPERVSFSYEVIGISPNLAKTESTNIEKVEGTNDFKQLIVFEILVKLE